MKKHILYHSIPSKTLVISNLARIQILAANIKPQTNTALRELQNILEVTCSSSDIDDDDCFKWMAVGGLWPISGD